ncbi:MAG TPA: hypothetical protein ENO02_08280 [Epsilonproteobacteria bacterium]|nr:hypothetical protein [Campylobacterota bacterium]
MLEKIKKWWIGEEYYLEGVLPGIRYKRHWTSKTAHTFADFYVVHWKWIWTSVFTVCGLVIAYLKLSQ